MEAPGGDLAALLELVGTAGCPSFTFAQAMNPADRMTGAQTIETATAMADHHHHAGWDTRWPNGVHPATRTDIAWRPSHQARTEQHEKAEQRSVVVLTICDCLTFSLTW